VVSTVEKLDGPALVKQAALLLEKEMRACIRACAS
jgi:hypothetical protein